MIRLQTQIWFTYKQVSNYFTKKPDRIMGQTSLPGHKNDMDYPSA